MSAIEETKNELKALIIDGSARVGTAGRGESMSFLYDKGLGELELSDVIDEKFSKGEGVLMLNANMPDNLLLLSVKQALKASQGKPFTVVSQVSKE